MNGARSSAAVALALAALAGAEATARVLEPALPTHRLWYDTLPALRVQQMRELGHADVVFGGHSMVHCGIRPNVVLRAAGRPDLVGYNAALHRGFYGVAVPFLLDAALPMLKPGLVLMGISVFDLNDNGPLISETEEKYTAALLGRRDAVGRSARALAHHSALFRNKGSARRPGRVVRAARARLRSADVIDDDVRDSRHNVGPYGEWLGYASRGFHTTENMRRHLVDDGLHAFEAGGSQVESMKRHLRVLANRGVDVGLVFMPPSSALWGHLPGGAGRRDDVIDVIRKLAADAGLPLLEASCDLHDEDHYADLAHLNGHGREVFSEALGRRLGEAVERGEIRLA